MNNIEVWLYIILAVIYLISSVLKKTKLNKQKKDEEEKNYPDENPPKTFEELLEEITGKKTLSDPSPNNTESANGEPISQPTYYGETIESVDNQNDEYRPKKEVYNPYEKYNRVPSTIEEPKIVNYDEKYNNNQYGIEEDKYKDIFKKKQIEANAKLEHKKEENSLFNVNIETNSIGKDIHNMLKDKQNIKKAIILSDILNRKYC